MGGQFFGGLFLTALSLFMLRHAIKSAAKARASRSWPVVPGVMLKAEILRPLATGSRHNFIAEYEYRVREKTLIGTRVAAFTISARERVNGLAESHAVGRKVDVFVNPLDETDTLLVVGAKDPKKPHGEIWLASLGILIGVVLISWSTLGG